RGFFVLIPDQRPSEHGAPEVPNLSRTVARNRSESTAARQERIVRFDDAELVAFGVGKHDMRFVWALTDVDVAGTDLDQPPDRLRLGIEGPTRQINTDTCHARLLRRDRQVEDSETPFIRRHATALRL